MKIIFTDDISKLFGELTESIELITNQSYLDVSDEELFFLRTRQRNLVGFTIKAPGGTKYRTRERSTQIRWLVSRENALPLEDAINEAIKIIKSGLENSNVSESVVCDALDKAGFSNTYFLDKNLSMVSKRRISNVNAITAYCQKNECNIKLRNEACPYISRNPVRCKGCEYYE